MTDREFAALEQRLAPVLAAGSSREYRREVEALLAECRALRRPPDASGLMPAAGLAAVKGSFARHVYPRPDEVAALFAHVDAQAALIRELYGVIADLHADDPGRQALLERGWAEGREQAALAVIDAARGPDYSDHATDALFAAAERVRALGPCRPLLPPSESEREAGRLREALSAVVAARDCYDRYEVSLNEVYGAIAAARAALAEGGAP